VLCHACDDVRVETFWFGADPYVEFLLGIALFDI
jgi:hypothetical protein